VCGCTSLDSGIRKFAKKNLRSRRDRTIPFFALAFVFMTRYTIEFSDPAAHLIDVTMVIDSPIAAQTVSMPSWIPGSYMIREFARNIVSLAARQNGEIVSATKTDKSTWSFSCREGAPLTITYRVYAWDRSVRTNYFDQSRGFVNPAALLLSNELEALSPHEISVISPKFLEASGWKCATSLSFLRANAQGFGEYFAQSYDELIDHPIECAAFDEFTFHAGGVPHRFVISGRHRGDLERLKSDAQKICQAHIDLFADKDASGHCVPPFEQYVFQLHVVDDGYGGLEHRASTALICPRNDLPVKGDAAIGEGYLGLLALISHEYFHAWNVKRIKPAAFTTKNGAYDTSCENYTRLLWLFEGFTSYYDELMLVRAGLITENDYLKLIARHITQLMRTPGRATQSIADSSFDAWTKYYRQDENAPNAIVSYYLKGGLVALLLDLKLRAESKGTLDDVMRHLWCEYGKIGKGVPEDAFAVFEQCTGASLREFEAGYVNGTQEIDFAAALANVGIVCEPRVSLNTTDRGGPTKGAQEKHLRQWGMVVNDAGDVTLRYVLNDSAAHRAGLCAGDVLIAIDGLRATRGAITKHPLRFVDGETITIDYFRHDVLNQTKLTIPSLKKDAVTLTLNTNADAACATARVAWLFDKRAA
jgi:predicted metalloprotease with PDZ domain